MKKIITVLIILVVPIIMQAQDISGIWNGNLEVEKNKFRLFVFHIHQEGDKLITELDIPSLQQKGLKPRLTDYIKGELNINAPNLGFKYIGKWNKTSNQMEGTFYEGLNSQKLNLTRDAIIEVKPSRPQEPTKPYPYREKEVSFKNGKANITLAGSLTLPEQSGKKFAAVILITGSGPQDRDESFAGHKPFWILADYLTRNGIAVLRVDDRGFGKSTGNFDSATTYDFSTDVLSAIAFLKTQKEIDTKKIGLIGHSEGAIIAPMVANASKDVAFIIMLAGTGVSGKELSLIQATTLRTFHVPDEEAYRQNVKNAIDIAAANKPVEVVRTELTAYYKQSTILKSLIPSNMNVDDFIANLVAARTTTWFRYFYNYNPAEEVKKVKVPVLALYCSKDNQVHTKYHMQPIKSALENGNSKDYTVKELEGLNHLFQEAKTGLMNEYSTIEQTFSPKALSEISNWINKRF